MRWVIRAAVSDADWQQGIELLRSVYVGEGYSVAERADQVYQRRVLEPEGIFLIAVDEQVVLGGLVLLHPGSALQQVAGSGEREFRLLAVRSDARGRGVGEALVREAIDRCKAARSAALVLWTRPAMTAAQRLYERLGFVRVPDRDRSDPRGFTRLMYRIALA